MNLQKFMAKGLAAGLAITMAAGLVGCSGTQQGNSGSSAGNVDTAATYRVGIVQYTNHSSLDEISAAIQNQLQQLALSQPTPTKIEVELKNGQGDAATINDICKMFVAEGVDVIIPIATPAAMTAAAAVQGTDIPLVYSAVTDPVAAQLANSMDAPGQNMTGTSDYIDTNRILDLALTQNPQLKKLGIVYNMSETNSTATVEQLKPVLEQKQIQSVERTVTTPGDVQLAVQDLISQGVEAIFVPIDNTVASAMSVVSQQAIDAKIPVYTAADSLVRDGGLATIGVNYTQLGEKTAQMVMDVLQGQDPASMPVQVLDDLQVTVNTTTAAALGIDPNVFDVSGNGYTAVE